MASGGSPPPGIAAKLDHLNYGWGLRRLTDAMQWSPPRPPLPDSGKSSKGREKD